MSLPPPKAMAWERGELAQVAWDAERRPDNAWIDDLHGRPPHELLNGQIGIVKSVTTLCFGPLITLYFPREHFAIERQYRPAQLLRVGSWVPTWPPHLDYLGPDHDADLSDA